ncbi:MAG: molybdopterin synthase sulfur carrier subunit [Gemmatimonadetes bacterium]|nr:MAG: molybdopterin synthase sulfur carrier subunit [Gemmatimonadota bacterium]
MATGTVQVRFFARYAELAGCETTAVAVAVPATVADVVRQVREAIPSAARFPERPLAAVNMRHVKLDAPVNDGDEVAFLPPVAGG